MCSTAMWVQTCFCFVYGHENTYNSNGFKIFKGLPIVLQGLLSTTYIVDVQYSFEGTDVFLFRLWTRKRLQFKWFQNL